VAAPGAAAGSSAGAGVTTGQARLRDSTTRRGEPNAAAAGDQ
jgi:hypothetical protein